MRKKNWTLFIFLLVLGFAWGIYYWFGIVQ
ncbi:hypothetical protein SAMN05216353_103191 [Halobacillus alkaliphilus]|uniref:Uncharacterized protein n=1 Tax=Halobacillus alkaliphilus TaxID=396056 RepID=A0A1I2KBL6_9BACI|nr:hypothetical protein SAMN05216353_103191 [Halobacillus alkaliphilus]